MINADAKRLSNAAIVLVGFMGAGKSSVGPVLAHHLQRKFVDIDDVIVATDGAGRTVAQIIDQDGEARFRVLETEALIRVIGSSTPRVIATGGGAFAREENRELLAADGCIVVWLDVPFDTCWQRISKQGASRPLARDRAAASKLFTLRHAVYELAQIRIAAGTDSAEHIAAAVAAAVERL
jgi:shikimate kinase